MYLSAVSAVTTDAMGVYCRPLSVCDLYMGVPAVLFHSSHSVQTLPSILCLLVWFGPLSCCSVSSFTIVACFSFHCFVFCLIFYSVCGW